MTKPLEEVTDRTFLPRMTALYAEINTVWDRHGDMPEDVCDLIVQATMSLSDAIMNAPITCEDDIAYKLRFAADLISDKCGVVLAERPAVERALSDLIALRESEWHADGRLLQRCKAVSATH